MEPAIAISGGFLALGCLLTLWSILQDVKKRRQGLQTGRFLQQSEQLGILIIFCSIFFPAARILLQLSDRESVRIAIFVLILGLFLLLGALINLFLKVIEKLLTFIRRKPLARLTRLLVEGATFSFLEMGILLMLAGCGFLIFVLTKK